MDSTSACTPASTITIRHYTKALVVVVVASSPRPTQSQSLSQLFFCRHPSNVYQNNPKLRHPATSRNWLRFSLFNVKCARGTSYEGAQHPHTLRSELELSRVGLRQPTKPVCLPVGGTERKSFSETLAGNIWHVIQYSPHPYPSPPPTPPSPPPTPPSPPPIPPSPPPTPHSPPPPPPPPTPHLPLPSYPTFLFPPTPASPLLSSYLLRVIPLIL
ncbi:hypothetical protein Pmani_016248 [Petrolisthes manimaculis]|uniref:Uncharacterized protein n=1 Tax=Petrolisthes manimaculis TaxID=1843537 RepID=A0AAE1UB72_9EUCA|nr:hypothetical protein Pmani_016248 [Petrolisthes manimaculis]